jgi:N-acetylglucosaminyl-diphospho-decaprenol L-rhamnosyltransferase
MACDVSVLIVNWNAGVVLENCLRSLPAALGLLAFEIWVVDNASSDGSPQRLRQHFPEVKLQANPLNAGFAAANNQAARLAEGRYLLLLNPDTLPPAGSLEALWSFAEANPRVGVLGPRLTHADGSFQRSCWHGFPGLGMAVSDALYLWKFPRLPLARQIELEPAQLRQPIDVDHLLGACLLIRRETWEQVGGLDERFFLFLEETDWCYRAQRAGWRVVYDPLVSVTHLGEHSVNQNPQRNLPQFYRSYIQFYRKHFSLAPVRLGLLKAIIAAAALLRIGLWQLRALRRLGPTRLQARAMQAGYGQVLRELPGL